MEERRMLSTTRQSSTEIARTNFNTVRKNGFDPQEVRSHLETVAREVGHLETRIRDLQEQLSEALRRAANPSFDEATLASALGAQSAAILRSAHEEAGRVTAEAQARSALLFTESQQRAASHLMEAQERAASMLTEAEHAVAQLDQEARLGAERLIESAKVNGDALVERGREQGRAIVEQANEARRSVLNDLAVKRKALHIQIDQLRAARDSMNSFVVTVRDQIDALLDNINGSDEAARHAALEALRLRAPVAELSEEEMLAGTPLRHVPEPQLQQVPSTGAVTNLEPMSTPTAPVPVAPPASTSPTPAPSGHALEPDMVHDAQSFIEDDVAGTDVVNEIFARLRKASLEERGASAHAPKKAAPVVKSETPVGELFSRRDQAIGGSLAVLTRKVKRALQDDQNVTLERLRDVKGPITDELEDELEQRRRYADAAVDALADATAAGMQFALDEAGAASDASAAAGIDDCAADLAVTIVLALRKRILADGNGDATERANAAYKEWRGARVERLCTDAARRAFHLGVATAATGRNLRFLPAPNDAPCDACALDATSPPRPAGQAFPSGSAYPPLHAGCACTVVPA
jgi:cell division septum initiation protein DivIVA